MAGYENIKNKGFDHRSTGELREISSRGGKKSGEVRRRQADFRKTLNLLLTAKIDSEEWEPVLKALGVDCTLESAMLMSMIRAALEGDVSAANFVAKYAGQSDKPMEDIRNRDADTELKQARKQAVTGEHGAGSDEDGVEIINDAPKEAGENIGDHNSEVSVDI